MSRIILTFTQLLRPARIFQTPVQTCQKLKIKLSQVWEKLGKVRKFDLQNQAFESLIKFLQP